MFAAIARFSYRFRWPVVIVFIVLFPLAGGLGGGLFRALDSGGFDDPGAESFKADQQLLDELGSGGADLIALYTVPAGSVQDASVGAGVRGALARAARDPAVERIASFYTTGSAQFVSTDGTRTFAVLVLRSPDAAKEAAAKRLEPLLAADGASV